MLDYQTPSSLLLVAAAAELDREAAQQAQRGEQQAQRAELERRPGLRLGYKLLVFLQCCLLGERYPPGESVCGDGGRLPER